jgi:hypothetical protein
MIGKDLIGRESKPVRVRIEANTVRRFAEAAGIPFNNQVPPTFVSTFMESNIDGIDLMQHGAIHGEQKFTYYQPVSVGDYITYTCRIKDVFERSGKPGKMTFAVIETTGRDPMGEEVFTINTTVIFIERGAEDETPLGLSG